MQHRDAEERSLVDLAAAVERASAAVVVGDDIAAIEAADLLAERSQRRLHDVVASARVRGVSWQQIGDALGVSRQAAFKRFGSSARDDAEGGGMGTIDLTQRTTDVFRRLDAGDYEAVRALMTYSCGRVLTKRKVMAVWNEVVSATGRLEGCDDLTVHTPDGRTTLERFVNRRGAGAVVHATLRHEAGEWTGRVAYNADGRIVGLLVAPLHAENLPF
jgi:hypothetical protein